MYNDISSDDLLDTDIKEYLYSEEKSECDKCKGHGVIWDEELIVEELRDLQESIEHLPLDEQPAKIFELWKEIYDQEGVNCKECNP